MASVIDQGLGLIDALVINYRLDESEINIGARIAQSAVDVRFRGENAAGRNLIHPRYRQRPLDGQVANGGVGRGRVIFGQPRNARDQDVRPGEIGIDSKVDDVSTGLRAGGTVAESLISLA